MEAAVRDDTCVHRMAVRARYWQRGHARHASSNCHTHRRVDNSGPDTE